MFDQTKTVTLTGVTYQFVAQANHAELHFYVLGPDGKLQKGKDGKNVDYGTRWPAPPPSAQQGITAATFLGRHHLLGQGQPDARRPRTSVRAPAARPSSKCPWKKPPAPGKACRQCRRQRAAGLQHLLDRRFELDETTAARGPRAAVLFCSTGPRGPPPPRAR